MNIAEIDHTLLERYRSLAVERDGHPVYGIEHGLNAVEIRGLAGELSKRIEIKGVDEADGLFAYIAVASEMGYIYEGFLSGYWPGLEALLHRSFFNYDRETLSSFFKRAHEEVGMARPDDTHFTRTYRHIAWPLANALAPRQIHLELSDALLAASTLAPDDASLVDIVRRNCRASGMPRLVEWSENEARVKAVVTALLGQPDGCLSLSIIERLTADAMTAPMVRDRLVRAKAVRVRRQRSSPASPIDRETPDAEVDSGYEYFGGLLLGLRRYACGIPLGIRADAIPVSTSLIEEGSPNSGTKIAPGKTAFFNPSGPAKLKLDYSDRSGVQRSAVLNFEDAEPLPPLVSISVHPVGATLSDLRKGQFSLIFNLARAEDDERISVPENLILTDVPLALTLSLIGRPSVSAKARIPRVPGRLGTDSKCLDHLRNRLEEMAVSGEPPRTALLRVDLGVSNQAISLSDPEPAIEWVEGEEGWYAVPMDIAEDEVPTDLAEDEVPTDLAEDEVPTDLAEDENLPDVLRVPASDPVSEPEPRLASGSNETFLLKVSGYGPDSAIVVGPRIRRGLSSSQPTPPDVHRRLSRSRHGPGLLAEIEAWLSWSCARPVHMLAAMEACQAANSAERALVTTLCGDDWLTGEETTKRSGGFVDLLGQTAIQLDAVKLDELRGCGFAIDERDLSELQIALVKVFQEDCFSLFAVPDDTRISDDCAAQLDEAVNRAWELLNPQRIARGLDELEPDTGNDTETWREIWTDALACQERRNLSEMILPLPLAQELRKISYATADPTEVVRVLAEHRLDLGQLSRTGRRMKGDDILSVLALWTAPRAFAQYDWRSLAVPLLEDRMTSRALRYASLRMRDAMEALE